MLPHLARPAGDADPLPARRRRHAVLREEHPSRARRAWIRRVGASTAVTFPVIDDLAGLTYFVNLNSLELHVPSGARGGRARRGRCNPDRLVIDLDPGPGTGLHECARVAAHRARPARRHRPRHRSRSPAAARGMQLYAVLPGAHTSDQIRDTVQQLAQELTKKHPDLVVWKMAK